MGECPLMTQSGHRAFVLRVICRLRIPLRFAHARDGDPLEYAGFCEKVASRKGFSLRTRLHVDDEQGYQSPPSRCLSASPPRKRELNFVVRGNRGATECAGCGADEAVSPVNVRFWRKADIAPAVATFVSPTPNPSRNCNAK